MKNLVKEKIGLLEKLLTEITELIEQHIEIEQIDLREFDTSHKNDPFPSDLEDDYYYRFRKTIISYKNDQSFYDNDIPQLESLLANALSQLQVFKNDSESRSIGNRNKPNDDIIKLINQRILNTKSPISGTMIDKVFSGFLTEDGYIELDINGSKKKFGSLRRAAFVAWGRDIQSQWKFWKVKDEIEEKPLEYFRKLIDRL
jgi:hypothetical protein